MDLIPEYPWLILRSRIQQNLRMRLHQRRNKRRAKISTVHSYNQSKLSTQTIKRTGRIVHFFTGRTEQLHAVVSKYIGQRGWEEVSVLATAARTLAECSARLSF